jgi:phosphoglycolate phosphatase
MGALTRAFCEVAWELAGIERETARVVYLSLAGMGPAGQFREVLRRAGGDQSAAERLADVFWQRSWEIAAPAYPEVPCVLQTLAARGFEMFVSSGGRPDLVTGRARRAGIADFFRLLLGTEDANPNMAKGPSHFRLFAEALGIAASELPSRAWMVGDGPYDMQVARQAGIRAIGRLTGANAEELRRAGAVAHIRDLSDLLNLLDQS